MYEILDGNKNISLKWGYNPLIAYEVWLEVFGILQTGEIYNVKKAGVLDY